MTSPPTPSTYTVYKVIIEYLPPGATFEDGLRHYTRIITATSPAVAIRRAVKFAPHFVTNTIQDILVEEHYD